MEKRKTPTRKPSSKDFYEAAYKLLATPLIIPAAKFVAALTTKSPEDQLGIDRINFYRYLVAKFPGCLSLKLLQVYSSRDPRVKDETRESAIRLLCRLLLSEVDASLNFAVIYELSPLLISCLGEQNIPDATFKILTQLVNRIATDIFTCHEATWLDLRKYISSTAESDFEKAVFVFQSLSMPLDGDEFVIPLMEKLFPAIMIRLRGESQWDLAFVGGFCAAIHLLETTRVDLVGHLAFGMLVSVNTGRELGLLGKALREVEIVVVKQSGWYCTAEFRFVLGFIRRINLILAEIAEEETTKTVLQRIKMLVEKKTSKSADEIDNGGEEWLNQRH